jgi:hypothetical protein
MQRRATGFQDCAESTVDGHAGSDGGLDKVHGGDVALLQPA